ncbi:MAG: hypothetical protein ABJC09_10930 [Terriglobia bacterium]
MNIRQAISGKERVRVVALIDGAAERATLHTLAARESWRLAIAHDHQALLRELRQAPAVVVCEGDWRAILESLRAAGARCRMILAAPQTVDKLWLEVLELGGYDVVTSPFHERRLIDAIDHAWAELMK